VIPLSHSCRNLGITFDCTLSMSGHIYNVCKSVRYQLRNVGLIRKYPTRPATEKIVHALISSRLDFETVFFFTYPKLNFLNYKNYKNSRSHCPSYQETHSHCTGSEVTTLATSRISSYFQTSVAYLSLHQWFCSYI
jgi:hypothetical protein